MSNLRITATRPDGTVVDRQVEIRNDQHLETALAKAWADVLGGRCAARQVPEQEPPPALQRGLARRRRPGEVRSCGPHYSTGPTPRMQPRRERPGSLSHPHGG